MYIGACGASRRALSGDSHARRSKQERAWGWNRRGRFRPGSCGHPAHRHQNCAHIREPMKPAAPADTVTAVRLSRQLVIGKRMWRRRDNRVCSIAPVAVRRVNGQSGQHDAQQPRDNPGARCANTGHAAYDNSTLTGSPAAQCKKPQAHVGRPCRKVGFHRRRSPSTKIKACPTPPQSKACTR